MTLDDLRDALEGQEKLTESYESGGPLPYDSVLVQKLLGNAQGLKLGTHKETTEFIRENVPKQLDYIPDFDYNMFLDAITLGWSLAPSRFIHLDHLLTESMMALHSAGLNDFTLDLTCVPPSGNYSSLFTVLKGEEDNVLKVTCIGGSCAQLGWRIAYAYIGFSGTTQVVGEYAEHSVIRINNPREEINAVASGATHSEFYIPDMTSMPFVDRSAYCFDEGSDSLSGYKICGSCSFYVDETDDYLLRQIEMNCFWDHENKLYVPDGKSGWEEVLPE